MEVSEPHNPRFPEQDENGVDLSIIRANLRLTPTDRIRRNFAAMKSMVQMRRTFKTVAQPNRAQDDVK